VLRHVSAAFSEDPVRVLRVARFAARYADFSVAPETLALMRAMAASGEVDSLVAERVWQELSKGLMEEKPSRMFDVLIEANAMESILPELSALRLKDSICDRIDRAAGKKLALAARFAVLIASIDARRAAYNADLRCDEPESRALSISQRLRVPRECNDLAELAIRHGEKIRRSHELDAEGLLNLLLGSDALRRPTRFQELLSVCDYLFDGAITAETVFLRNAQNSLRDFDPKTVLGNASTTADIPRLIRAAQLRIISEFIDFRHNHG
jgi:tRNA nucleotidyltransferase (CCA-adding enzyme)